MPKACIIDFIPLCPPALPFCRKRIIQALGTDQFKRIRIGVDRPSNGMAIVDYVLQRFSDQEMKTMNKVIEHSARAVEAFIDYIHSSRYQSEMFQ